MRKGKYRLKGKKMKSYDIAPHLQSSEGTYNDEYYPVNILEIPNCSNKRKNIHPTQKPVDLIRYLIRTYTNPGDIVLDNCMGSGTTAIAAMREGRDYIGFEKDEQFFEMCERRIADERELMSAKADPLY